MRTLRIFSIGLFAIAALTAEFAAILAADHDCSRAGVTSALPPSPGTVTEQYAGTGLGTALPLGLHIASLLLTRRRSRLLSGAASLAILGGSLAMRCGVMAAGNASARRPGTSLRFARPAPR